MKKIFCLKQLNSLLDIKQNQNQSLVRLSKKIVKNPTGNNVY